MRVPAILPPSPPVLRGEGASGEGVEPAWASRRRGFTLIEVAAVVAFLAVLMALLASVMWSAYRIQAAATTAFEDQLSTMTLADRFRADVADARDSPDLAGNFKADPMCLILRDNDGAMVLYRFTESAVERIVLGEGDPRSESFRIVRSGTTVEFGKQGRLMTMTFRGPGEGTLTIAAALGGKR